MDLLYDAVCGDMVGDLSKGASCFPSVLVGQRKALVEYSLDNAYFVVAYT